ncbi:MAG: hypothetical protein IIX02_05315, partial [Clostridia bacterium]|nr:hypothetical protein [Clostridia bacterium]
MKTKQTNKQLNKGKVWLQKETRPYRASIILLTCFTVLATLVSLTFAYLVSFVINSADAGKEKQLWIFSAALLGLVLLKILLKTFDSFYAEKLRAKLTTDLRTRTFGKILRSNYTKTSSYHSGELVNRLTTDIHEVSADTVGLMPAL